MIALLLLATGLISYVSVTSRLEGSQVAVWWPAAGVATIAVLASRGDRVWAAIGVFAITALANFLGGTDLLVSLGFGLGNAAEAWIVARIVSRGTSEVRLRRIGDMNRFLLGTIAGSVTLAVIAGLVVAASTGSGFLLNATVAFASHFSALMIITPIAVVSRRVGRRVSMGEVALQLVVVVGLMLVTFWPGQHLPIAFVLLAALLWAALRFPTVVVSLEMILVAVLLTYLAPSGGPFAYVVTGDARLTEILVQVFLIVHAATLLYVSTSRNEWGFAVAKLQAHTELLRSSIVASDQGILIAELVDHERLRIVEVNSLALGVLGLTGIPTGWVSPGIRLAGDGVVVGDTQLDPILTSGLPGHYRAVRGNRDFDVVAYVHEGVTGTSVITVKFTDAAAADVTEVTEVTAVPRNPRSTVPTATPAMG